MNRDSSAEDLFDPCRAGKLLLGISGSIFVAVDRPRVLDQVVEVFIQQAAALDEPGHGANRICPAAESKQENTIVGLMDLGEKPIGGQHVVADAHADGAVQSLVQPSANEPERR